MIIIIIRSLFIISNYFWQPKPLVVAKIYPVLINGICWNRILNTTQSLPEPTKSTSLFTPDSCFNIKINILSGNINSRSKLENMYSSVRPTTRVSARLPILFGKNASVSSLDRGGITGQVGLMEEYSQLPDERGRAGIDPESNIYHEEWPGSRMLPRLVSSVWAILSCSAEWWLTESRMNSSGWTCNKMGIRSE